MDLRVRFNLVSPLAFWANKPIHPLSLDGILTYAATLGNDSWKSPSDIYCHVPDLVDLPLDKAGIPGEEYYRASMMFVPSCAFWKMDAFIKKADSFDALDRYAAKEKQNIANQSKSGPFRQFYERYLLLCTPYIEFYVSTDSLDDLGDLLHRVKQLGYIGSKHNVGYGKLRERDGIEVFDAKVDYSVWKDGKPTRPVPVDSVSEKLPLAIQYVSYRPPYFHMANKKECYIPPAEQWYPGMDSTPLFQILEKGAVGNA